MPTIISVSEYGKMGKRQDITFYDILKNRILKNQITGLTTENTAEKQKIGFKTKSITN